MVLISVFRLNSPILFSLCGPFANAGMSFTWAIRPQASAGGSIDASDVVGSATFAFDASQTAHQQTIERLRIFCMMRTPVAIGTQTDNVRRVIRTAVRQSPGVMRLEEMFARGRAEWSRFKATFTSASGTTQDVPPDRG